MEIGDAKLTNKGATNKKSRLLDSERGFSTLVAALIFCLALTGYATLFVEGFCYWMQISWLAHAVLGALLTFILGYYIVVHIKRTLGFRRWGLFISGLLLLIIVVAMIVTGWYWLLVGVSETTRWLSYLHWISASLFLFFTLSHLCFHWWTFPKKRLTAGSIKSKNRVGHESVKKRITEIFVTLKPRFLTTVTLSVIGLGLAIGLLSFVAQKSQYPFSDESVEPNYQLTYGDHIFRPSQAETWHNRFVDPKQVGYSEDCKGCHQEIFEEWSESLHRHAASDKSYQTNISLLAKNKGVASTRYCEGCHAPVALLTGQLTEGGDHGGVPDTHAFDEGVGCLGCHNIERPVHLKGVASYLYQAHTRYLFEGYDATVLKGIRQWLIRLQPKQHREDMARPVLKTPEQCATCHVQFMDKDMNNWGWVKMQDEYSAWLASSYAGQHNNAFSHSERTTCQDCHMPLVGDDEADDHTFERDPSANHQGEHRSHRFPGANTFVPILNGDTEQLKTTVRFLQQDKLGVTIEEPRQNRASQTLDPIDESIRTSAQTPWYFYLGDSVTLNVLVANRGVGHNFPGGTLDINQAWVYFVVKDVEGRILYESGAVDPGGVVDPGAVFYRSLPVDRSGQLVWKHDLFNRVGESYKNVIPAGKTDILRYTFDVPYWAKGPITVVATVKYRKLNQRYAKWALQEAFFDIPIIDMGRDVLQIPLRERPPLTHFTVGDD